MSRSLGQLALDPSIHLDAPLSTIVWSLPVPRHLRQVLLREALTHQVTVRQFAQQPRGIGPYELPAVEVALNSWFGAQPQAVVRATKAELATVAQVAQGSDLPDLGDWDVALFDDDLESHSFRGLNEVLSGAIPISGAHAGRLATGVDGFLSMVRTERATARPPKLVPTGSTRADAFLAALQPEAERLARLYPLGLLDPEVRIRAEDQDILATVRTRFSPPRAVRWRAPGVDLETAAVCECGRDTCLHRAAALWDLTVNGHIPRDFFATLFSPRWERLLNELAAEEHEPRPQALIVRLSDNGVTFALSKLTQKGDVSRSWRAVYRLGPELSKLSGRDLEIARCVALHEVGSGDLGDLPTLLAGHPRVCWGNDKTFLPCRVDSPRVEFVEKAEGVSLSVRLGPTLLTQESSRGLKCTGGTMLMRQQGANIVLYVVPKKVMGLVRALGRLGPEYPTEALPALHEAATRLETVARVDLPDGLRGEEVAPAMQHRLQVVRDPVGVALCLRVEPLADGPLFTPGTGAPVAATFDGARRTWARRDLEAELRGAVVLAGELGLEGDGGKEFNWQLPAGAGAVEVLRRVQAQPGLALEWKGVAPRFTAEAKTSQLSLRVTRSKDWFDVAGTLEVDGRRVALAELLEAARARRRWVQLGADDFVQLSKELVDAVAPLAHLGDEKKAPTLTLGSLPALEALATAGADVTAAAEWVKLIDRLKAAQTRTVTLPKVKVTPRDYQRVGFEWLMRLADWSTGAVLADDMGLGKTLQALMLLLARSKSGPALVVAPSSVVHTWRTEAAQHAPGLKVKAWGDGTKLEDLGKGHVLLATWTMFARDTEQFSEQRFATVILDEAHAIKNGSTQRAKAAHRLQADFVLGLSGTPIENHVGELWSLFRAVMPSLLGNEEAFRRRFGSDDEAALQALARLIRPFILRRTKGQVATELPPRTELDVVVPLTEAERALYEDVRLNALAKVGENQSKRFEVLAALTRLRLTACHPRLVDAKWKGPTSKLDRLEELLADLTQAGHRALVFSQFTSHLALVQAALRKRGITFSYLDGQTPLAERARLVETFQAGRGGAVFLISLKAGGTGLTLTAADYVIHLDPWWNPAVEDQASDRAHRLGQRKPVTVYRLISEGTIEQKILALHTEKRELVDSLLDGTDAAGAMKTEDLFALLREG